MNKSDLINKATAMLADNKSANAVCITSDGSLFFGESKSFADSHAQKLKNTSILVVGRDDKFKDQNSNLFFDGSRWGFVSIAEGDNKGPSDEKEIDEMSVDELKAKAKDLPGYKTKLNKAQLIDLIKNQ